MQDLKELLTLWFKLEVTRVDTPRGPGFRIDSKVGTKTFRELVRLVEIHDGVLTYNNLPQDADQGLALYVVMPDVERENDRDKTAG